MTLAWKCWPSGLALVAFCLAAGPSWAQQDVEAEIDAALSKPKEEEPPPRVKKRKGRKGKDQPRPQPIAAEDEAAAPAATAEPAAEAPEVSDADELPQIGEDQLAVFVLQRGFYFSSDLGTFWTWGGVRGYGNFQPYVSLKAGFDVGENISIQAAFASGYSSGNALSQNDAPGAGGQEVVNFGLFMMGGEAVFAVRPTDRFAIEPKVGGGATLLHPQPTNPKDLSQALPGLCYHLMGGLDLKYLTLLTDFTAGLSITQYYIFGPNIPATAVAFVVRYTF